MQTFEKWQPVEVRFGANWVRGVYVGPAIEDDGEDVHLTYCGTVGLFGSPDGVVRPLASFEATGDDLRLTAEALGHYAHERVRLDMEHNGGLTDDTLAVQRLHEWAKRAMEVGR